MNKFLKELKKYTIGFISVTELQEHHSGALFRIFLLSKTGPVTIYWFKDEKFICKGKRFLDQISNNKVIQSFRKQ